MTAAFGIKKAANEINSTAAWSRLRQKLEQLNREGEGNVAYKLLFLVRTPHFAYTPPANLNSRIRESVLVLIFLLPSQGRHGEGVHNVAEQRYGTEAWDVSRSCFILSEFFAIIRSKVG